LNFAKHFLDVDLLDGLAKIRMPDLAVQGVECIERSSDVEGTVPFDLGGRRLTERTFARAARAGRLRNRQIELAHAFEQKLVPRGSAQRVLENGPRVVDESAREEEFCFVQHVLDEIAPRPARRARFGDRRWRRRGLVGILHRKTRQGSAVGGWVIGGFTIQNFALSGFALEGFTSIFVPFGTDVVFRARHRFRGVDVLEIVGGEWYVVELWSLGRRGVGRRRGKRIACFREALLDGIE